MTIQEAVPVEPTNQSWKVAYWLSFNIMPDADRTCKSLTPNPKILTPAYLLDPNCGAARPDWKETFLRHIEKDLMGDVMLELNRQLAQFATVEDWMRAAGLIPGDGSQV